MNHLEFARSARGVRCANALLQVNREIATHRVDARRVLRLEYTMHMTNI